MTQPRMERQKKPLSVWKRTAEKEAAKLLSNMNIAQLREQVAKLEEKEREQRERMQGVYQSHLANLTSAFARLMEQKENVKEISKYAQSLYVYCQQPWNEREETKPSYDVEPREKNTTERLDNLDMASKLELCRDDLSLMVDSLESATRHLDSGDFLACYLDLCIVRQRKEQLEQRLVALTTEPLKQFLSSLWDSQEVLCHRLEHRIAEYLETTDYVHPSTAWIGLLLLHNNSKSSTLDDKCREFFHLRYRCLSQYLCTDSSSSSDKPSLETLEAGMNCITSTLLTYEELMQERTKPTLMIPNLESYSQDAKTTTVVQWLLPLQEDHCAVLDKWIGEWIEKVNLDMNTHLERWLKQQVVTEQNVDRWSPLFHSTISKLDTTLSTLQDQNRKVEHLKNLRRTMTVSLVTCIDYVLESMLNHRFTEAEERIGQDLGRIIKENISTSFSNSYWKYCGDWSAMFWMYIDQEEQERKEHQKTFTRSLLDSEPCSWEVWMDEFLIADDINIRQWYVPFTQHLQQLFHQTFPFLQSLLFDEEKQSVVESVHQQMTQRCVQFFQSLEKKLDLLLPNICPLCDTKRIPNNDHPQDFVLSGVLYLYRCCRLVRNFVSSCFITIAELQKVDIGITIPTSLAEQKSQYHLIHHIVYLSMIRWLKPQSFCYSSLEQEPATTASSNSPNEWNKYPSEALVQWLMQFGKYNLLLDALYFPEDTLRLVTCSHFIKWLECCVGLVNLNEKASTSSLLQLYIDLVWMGDICLIKKANQPEQQQQEDTFLSPHAKWKEYVDYVETLLSHKDHLAKDRKEQVRSYSSVHLDRMGHLLGRLSMIPRSHSKQQERPKEEMETYSLPILPAVGRFPYLPAPTPSLLHRRYRNKRFSETKWLETTTATNTTMNPTDTWEQSSSTNKNKKENTSVVDFASQFVGQQMGKFGFKFLDSWRAAGGASSFQEMEK